MQSKMSPTVKVDLGGINAVGVYTCNDGASSAIIQIVDVTNGPVSRLQLESKTTSSDVKLTSLHRLLVGSWTVFGSSTGPILARKCSARPGTQTALSTMHDFRGFVDLPRKNWRPTFHYGFLIDLLVAQNL